MPPKPTTTNRERHKNNKVSPMASSTTGKIVIHQRNSYRWPDHRVGRFEMNSSKVTAFGGATYTGDEVAAINNTGIDEFLLAALGPQQMDNRALLLLVTIFYAVVFVTGVVGNLSVCLVITRSKSLHSAMNYYLVSLAIADLTIILLGR